MRALFITLAASVLFARLAGAQVLMSGGAYAQNFDALTNSTNPNWTNQVTLPGWYWSRGSTDATNYSIGAGTSTTGNFYSFGTNGVNASSDKALGSLASSGNNYAYGLRFTNDTSSAQTNFTISCTGEQWRVASVNTQKLAFAYQVGTLLTNADAANAQSWTALALLDFNSPNTNLNAGAHALDGNDPTNRVVFTSIPVTGAVVQPGQEIFFRWYDTDDTGSDDALAIDDLTVSFQATSVTLPPATNFPALTAQPQSQAVGKNGVAIFSVSATGNPAPAFQWQFNGTNLPGQTSPTLSLFNVTTNQAGNYSIMVTNSAGATNSLAAALVVMPVSLVATNGALRFLTYNVNGNGATNDWSTNAAQVQAIGRELVYFNADIITFNEIPYTNTWQMTNWVTAFMPGFYLALNSGTDGSIRSVIASRFPITRSQSWLGNSSLAPYGYTGTGFTRDLFEAELAVPNWPLPLHVFAAHLKATTTAPHDDANKRAAQASAVSNFFANTFLPGTNGSHPYLLSGDMNEDAFFPETSRYTSGQPIQRLTSAPTGLQLTTPVNPFGNAPSNTYTESIRNPLDTRFDYILPCGILFSNIVSSVVFRTDLLTNFPSNLFSNDDKIASDHLPVLLVFNNPFNTPFRLLSIARTNQGVTLNWESQNNRRFNIEASSNLATWTPFATNLSTTTTNSPFVFTTNNVADPIKFFRLYRVP